MKKNTMSCTAHFNHYILHPLIWLNLISDTAKIAIHVTYWHALFLSVSVCFSITMDKPLFVHYFPLTWKIALEILQNQSNNTNVITLPPQKLEAGKVFLYLSDQKLQEW